MRNLPYRFFCLAVVIYSVNGGVTFANVESLANSHLTCDDLNNNENNGYFDDLRTEGVSFALTEEDYASDTGVVSANHCAKLFEISAPQHVLEFLNENYTKNTFLILLNGENRGIKIHILEMTKFPNCLGSLAYLVANYFSVDRFYLQSPMRLYSVVGLPIQAKIQQPPEITNVFYLLLRDETWMFPGIEVGFKFIIGGYSLKTLSLEPKVFEVEDFLSESEMDSLVKCGEHHLERSPEKHYSDDPAFHNYRTSQTASLWDHDCHESLRIRQRARLITRLPEENMIEPLQLLKYLPGKWYKAHKDVFHNQRKPFVFRDEHRVIIPKNFHEFCNKWKLFLLTSYLNPGKMDNGDTLKSLFTKKRSPLFPEPRSKLFREKIVELGRQHRLLPIFSLARQSLDLAIRSTSNFLNLVEPFYIRAALESNGTNIVDVEDLAKSIIIQANEFAKSNPDLMLTITKVEQNRFLTLLPYLSTVEKGGETAFPHAKVYNISPGSRHNKFGLHDCEHGVLVPAIRGHAALFYHQTGNGLKEELSTHLGCPPEEITKYAINIFCWNVPWNDGIAYFN